MVTSPTKAAAAVSTLLSDPTYGLRASDLGAKLRAEDGAAALVDAVLQTL